MLTRRINLIRLAQQLEIDNDLQYYEKQDIINMDREEIEMYIEYLKGF